MYRHRGAAIRRLALLALLALIARACRAAPLPLQWHWLADKVPKAGVRPALLGFFQGLSMEICKGGPGNFTQLSYKWMDEASCRGAEARGRCCGESSAGPWGRRGCTAQAASS